MFVLVPTARPRRPLMLPGGRINIADADRFTGDDEFNAWLCWQPAAVIYQDWLTQWSHDAFDPFKRSACQASASLGGEAGHPLCGSLSVPSSPTKPGSTPLVATDFVGNTKPRYPRNALPAHPSPRLKAVFSDAGEGGEHLMRCGSDRAKSSTG